MTLQSIPRYKWILAFGDYVCIVSSFVLAIMLMPSSAVRLDLNNVLVLLGFALIWVFAMERNNLYNHRVVMNRSQQLVLLAKSALSALVLAVFVDYCFRPHNWLSSRGINATLYPSGVMLMSIWRMIVFRSLWKHETFGEKYIKRVAIIGNSKRAYRLAARLEYKPDADLQLVGIIDDALQPQVNGEEQRYKILGNKRELRTLAQRHNIHSFVIASDELATGEILEIADECTSVGAMVDVASESASILNSTAVYSPDAEFPVVHLQGSRNNLSARILKRATDIVLSSIALIILAPIFALLALIVKLSSPGPVVYKSRRIGLGGRHFVFYKFRSMKPEVPGVAGENIFDKYNSYIRGNQVVGKIMSDARVTAIGRFMRKTSLDELPQLWNVLKGDMSLVGPRPCMLHEYALYSEWHKKRLAVMPGCTGLWQVSDRKNISFNDMVLLDYYYIENVSPWFDFQIMLKTIPVMIFGRGDM